MRSRVIAAMLAAGVAGAASACSDAPAPAQPAAISVPVQFKTDAAGADAKNHQTHLSGDAERPDAERFEGTGAGHLPGQQRRQ